MHARTMMATTIASFALLTVALPQPQSESIEPDAQKNDPNPTADQVSEGGYSCGTNEAGGHPGGLYIPLQSASNTFDQFCRQKEGNLIYAGKKTEEVYDVTLTTGQSARIIMAIMNLYGGTWTVDYATCMQGMQGPMGSGAPQPSGNGCYDTGPDESSADTKMCNTKSSSKRATGMTKVRRDESNVLTKRDTCVANGGYEGGWYKMSNIGTFGSWILGSK